MPSYVKLTREEILKLANNETIVIIRVSRKEGVVSIHDKDGRAFGTGFITKIGVVKKGKKECVVETNGKQIPLTQLGIDGETAKKLIQQKNTRYFVCKVEPVKIRGIYRIQNR